MPPVGRDARRRPGRSFASVYPNNGTISGITALSGGHLSISQPSDQARLRLGHLQPEQRQRPLRGRPLANDTFQTTVYAPGTDVPLLAGPTFTANKSFQDVADIPQPAASAPAPSPWE